MTSPPDALTPKEYRALHELHRRLRRRQGAAPAARDAGLAPEGGQTLVAVAAPARLTPAGAVALRRAPAGARGRRGRGGWRWGCGR
ncbi:MAG TPA: hypothetical protein VFW96_22480 [Thermomicrobiales bacterium]|nr:hypothetical protein [Thermomicrobiales bacterium]